MYRVVSEAWFFAPWVDNGKRVDNDSKRGCGNGPTVCRSDDGRVVFDDALARDGGKDAQQLVETHGDSR